MPAIEWTAPDILRISGAYWQSAAVQTSVKLDLFTTLEKGPLTLADLAKAHDCAPRSLGMLVTALVAMGLLEREGELIIAPASALRLLSRNSAEYVGFIVRHHHSLMPGWSRLDEAVRTGSAARRSTVHTQDADEREAFLMGMFNIASQQAGRIASAIDLSSAARLLDLGAGPGTYGVYFCKANPHLHADLFDLPTSEPIANSIIKRFGMEDRVKFIGGNYVTEDVPQGYDVAWLSQVLHGEKPETAAEVVKKAGQAVNPGGRIYIQEFTLNDDGKGPLHPALFSLNMLVGTDGGQAYTEGALRQMLIAAGAERVDILDIELPQNCRILCGTMKK